VPSAADTQGEEEMFRARPDSGIVWVTGASSGIGLAVVRELAQRGFRVAVTARRAGELDRLVKEGAKIGTGVVVSYPGDVTDGQAMAQIVTSIEGQHGPISLAFLNAAVYFPIERDLFDAPLVHQTFSVNVNGAANCLAPLLPLMVQRGQGQIAINASLAGYGGLPNSMAYGSSKAAAIYLAESLRLTYAHAGLNIQLVSPGFVRTPMTDQNDYDMPFLMEPQVAARRICDGFERAGFEITFPRRLALTFKAAKLLPYPLYFWLADKLTRRVRR
jgi:NAD(P)-dependent dehydrogenase (short-subunit alcohol dehydrogenase family)